MAKKRNNLFFYGFTERKKNMETNRVLFKKKKKLLSVVAISFAVLEISVNDEFETSFVLSCSTILGQNNQIVLKKK